MKIEVKSLMFEHLLVYETKQLKEDWLEAFFMMEDTTLGRGIYKDGPVFFSVAPEMNEDKFGHFTYYLPMNESIELIDEEHFRVVDNFSIESALVLRQADEMLDFQTAYQKVKDYAVEHSIELEDTYYCVLVEVYNEYMIDLYVPMKMRGDRE